MGLLINGQWRDQWYDTSGSGGRFLRKDSAYRNWVTGRWRTRSHGSWRLSRRAWPLSPLRLACLPLGPSHTHPAVLKGARGNHPGVRRSLANAGKRLDF